jgi:hypothetical protein
MEKHRAAFLPAVDKLIAEMGAKILARTGSPIHLGYGAPAACSSVITGPTTEARSAAIRALASWPALACLCCQLWVLIVAAELHTTARRDLSR